MAGPQPLATQTTPWRKFAVNDDVAALMRSSGARSMEAFRRTVRDGTLRVLVADEPTGYHLSISFVDDCGKPTRYPTWDEIADARYKLLPEAFDFVMHLPPPGEYVACHPTTFHLHQHPERVDR